MSRVPDLLQHSGSRNSKPEDLLMPKILMPLGDATEALDTFYPYYRLPEDGYEVVVAGPESR